jgi:2-polyprenyl-3-methyl-5-hydroxy-6-metoxy-1,4-benzoquinol methylase
MTQSDAESDLAMRVGLLNLATSVRLSQALYVAARMDIASLLAGEPHSAEELATATGVHAPSLARLLRALVAFDILHESGPGLFALAPMGVSLQADHPQSVRDAVLTFVGEDAWRSWSDLSHCVQTGESATSHLYGVQKVFEYYAQRPELNALMNAGFAANGRVRADAVVAAYDFSTSGTLVDVGGGRGQLITTILRAHAHLRGVLFDQPHVVESAGSRVEGAGLADRLQIVAGDMFIEIPANGDTYLLMNIIHDWDDAQSLAILKNCHRAMRPKTTLLLIEQMLPSSITPSVTAQSQTLADLNMLVRTGGQERTEEEFRALFGEAGFDLVEVTPTQTAHSVIKGEWKEDMPANSAR